MLKGVATSVSEVEFLMLNILSENGYIHYITALDLLRIKFKDNSLSYDDSYDLLMILYTFGYVSYYTLPVGTPSKINRFFKITRLGSHAHNLAADRFTRYSKLKR